MNPQIINIHTHCFTFDQVPRHFLPGQALLARTGRGRKLLTGILLLLSRFHKGGTLERTALFLKRGNHPDQKTILEELAGYYPKDTRFAIHTIDFNYMGAGNCTPGNDFLHQAEELARIKSDPVWKDRIYPFFCVDPRRENIVELTKKFILEKGFAGIKLYPALGFYPFDERLSPLWEWAAAESIPIMVHCSRSGPVYGRNMPDKSRRIHPITGQPLTARRKKTYADYYTDPSNYEILFKTYPGIKICFAHFGGDRDCTVFYKEGGNTENNWFNQIVRFLKDYPGAYADISFSSADPDLIALFHVYSQDRRDNQDSQNHQDSLDHQDHQSCQGSQGSQGKKYGLCDKILFGSDFYMSHLKRNERWFSINVRSILGEETYRQISEINTERFLSRHAQ
jgi:predicted TIM-barrel fold metal-dependent hydrolase